MVVSFGSGTAKARGWGFAHLVDLIQLALESVTRVTDQKCSI